MRAAPVILFALAALQAPLARAEPVAVRLELEATPDCTTREELMARVRARSERIRLAEEAPTVVRASVVPAPALRTVTVALSVEQPDGRATERRIRAPTCAQATDALALLIVLALDPAAVSAPPPPPPVPKPPAAASPVAAVVAPPPAPPAPPVRTGWAVQAGGGTVVGPAPHPMPAFWVGGRLARDRPAFWSPALALSVRHAGSGALAEPGGTATFTLDTAILDACPARLAASAFEVRPCGSVQAGRLAAAGSKTYAPASSARVFGAAGASLLLAAHLIGPLQLGARLEADLTWQRDAFAFSPTVFHRAAAVTLAAGLSLGVRFR